MSSVGSQIFPKGAILEQIDVQQLGKSINFCIYPFDDVPFCKIGDEHSVFGSRDQANQLSHDLCRILRHKIGNCRGSAFKCDEGGWVDIDAIIDDRQVNMCPPKTSRARRYMGITEVIKWQESGYKKSRFQILAARFPSIMNPNDARAARQELAYMSHDQGERRGVRQMRWMVQTWCIRVTTGHSDFGFMSSPALANRYSARMGGSAFHVTCGKLAKHRTLRAGPRRNRWREQIGIALRGIRSMGQDELGDEDNAAQPEGWGSDRNHLHSQCNTRTVWSWSCVQRDVYGL